MAGGSTECFGFLLVRPKTVAIEAASTADPFSNNLMPVGENCVMISSSLGKGPVTDRPKLCPASAISVLYDKRCMYAYMYCKSWFSFNSAVPTLLFFRCCREHFHADDAAQLDYWCLCVGWSCYHQAWQLEASRTILYCQLVQLAGHCTCQSVSCMCVCRRSDRSVTSSHLLQRGAELGPCIWT
jgi:hypothetical protein